MAVPKNQQPWNIHTTQRIHIRGIPIGEEEKRKTEVETIKKKKGQKSSEL